MDHKIHSPLTRTDQAEPSVHIKSVCVFCGSRHGEDPDFTRAAHVLGTALADAGLKLVYGGGNVGLMGTVARAALDAGGAVTGVIPRHLARKEVMMEGLSDMRIVETMHDRKRLMFELSDAFVTLPGGIGTLDETIEIIVWLQLRLHDKPVLLVNEKSYWSAFMAMMAQVQDAGFAYGPDHDLFSLVPSADAVVSTLRNAPKPQVPDTPELT